MIIFALFFYYCSFSEDKTCIIVTVRRYFLIAPTSISFILQSIVMIEDVWGKKIINFLIPTNETPVIQLQNPAQGLQNHVVCNISKYDINLIKTRLYFRNMSQYQLGSVPFVSSTCLHLSSACLHIFWKSTTQFTFHWHGSVCWQSSQWSGFQETRKWKMKWKLCVEFNS